MNRAPGFAARFGRASLLLSLSLWTLSSACTLVVDVPGLQEGCASGTKSCEVTPGEWHCVSITKPEYGCARESCVPCVLPHSVEVCGGNGDCAIGTCEPVFENCDRDSRNGCEIDLASSYQNCGACGASCDDALRNMPRTASAECISAHCLVKECQPGYADCDGAASNGCEHSLGDGPCKP